MPKIKKIRALPAKIKVVNPIDSPEKIVLKKVVFPNKKISPLEQELVNEEQPLNTEGSNKNTIEETENTSSAKVPSRVRVLDPPIRISQTSSVSQEEIPSQADAPRPEAQQPYAPSQPVYTSISPRRTQRAYESSQEQLKRMENPVQTKPINLFRENPITERDTLSRLDEQRFTTPIAQEEMAPANKSRYYYRSEPIGESTPRRRRTDFL